MADNFNRTHVNGPLFITGSANTSTLLEVGTRQGIPQTGDADANPYTTSGQTRTAVLTRTASGVSMSAVELTTAVGGQKVGLPAWVQDNLTTSLASSAMRIAAVSGQTQITCPFPGSVIGVSGNLSANITAGTLRVLVSVNGTSVFAAANSATGVRTVYATQAPDVDAIARGDRIGVKLSTTADFAPANNDLTAVVWVEV